MNQTFVREVEQILRQAGDLVLSYRDRRYTYQQKEDRTFVTEADKKSEAFLIEHLGALLPESQFLAEESGKSVDLDKESGYWWVIDPIDGTTNFLHNNPYFCISVALMRGSTIIYGAIFAPYRDEFFYAVHEGGAFFNDTRMAVVNRDVSSVPMTIALGGPTSSIHRETYLKKMHVVQERIKSTRKNGSAALDLAYVAQGWIDACFLGKLSWWDIAAGVLLVRESGGLVSDIAGKEIAPGFDFCIAGHKAVYTMLQALVR